jgi:hypothetical protein
MNALDDEDERSHWLNVITILRSYKSYVEYDLKRRQAHLKRLSENYTNRLPNETFEQLWAIDKAADHNQTFLNHVFLP